jgi:hypothetical protein
MIGWVVFPYTQEFIRPAQTKNPKTLRNESPTEAGLFEIANQTSQHWSSQTWFIELCRIF